MAVAYTDCGSAVATEADRIRAPTAERRHRALAARARRSRRDRARRLDCHRGGPAASVRPLSLVVGPARLARRPAQSAGRRQGRLRSAGPTSRTTSTRSSATSRRYEIWYLNYDPLVGYDPGRSRRRRARTRRASPPTGRVDDDGLTWTFTIRRTPSGRTASRSPPRTSPSPTTTSSRTRWRTSPRYTKQHRRGRGASTTPRSRSRAPSPRPTCSASGSPSCPSTSGARSRPRTRPRASRTTPPIVGSGPFQCVEWKKGNFVKLVANPDYWWGPPKIDEIFFTFYTNADTMTAGPQGRHHRRRRRPPAGAVRQLENEPGLTAAPSPPTASTSSASTATTGPQLGQPGAEGREVPPGAQLGGRQAEDRRHRLRRLRRAGTTIIPPTTTSDPDWHWEPPADVKYALRPREGQAAARRGRLHGHRRRRHPRVQGQAHRAAPDGAHRVDRRARGRPSSSPAGSRTSASRSTSQVMDEGALSDRSSTTRTARSPPTTTCSSGAGTSTSTRAPC